MAAASQIHWDRVARVALVCVLFGLVVLYVGPIHSFWVAHEQAGQKRAEVQRLEREHARLQAEVKALHRPAALELEARKLGYVKVGERPYVVEALPKGP